MEKFREMLRGLDELGLSRDEFAIFGSGPMGIRGIRESSDVDIIVRPDVWDRLCEKYEREKDFLIRVGDVEVYKNWSTWFSDMDALIDDADVIEGYRFVKLKYVVEWKKANGREKDLRDVELIEEFLRER